MSSRTPPSPVDRLADRYELGPIIGRGGMGQVRKAWDTRLSRDVAIKVLHLGLSAPADRHRFEREARAAARINHPNVVAVYDVGEEHDELFIVMECLPGTTLADEIARGPLPIDRVARIGSDLLRALAAAHAQGVLHRDIKPSNVLFAADGTAKLGDFGIAKMGDDTDLTEVGSIVGTAPYLAPERLSGEPATAAGDLYSVGVLLYEALTGMRPFAGTSAVAVAHAMSTSTPAPIDAVRPDCPPSLSACVARAMRKDPAERFASAATMAAALAGGPDTHPLAPSPTLPAAAPPLATTPDADAPTVAVAPTVRDPAALPPTVAFPPTDGGRPSRLRGGVLLAALAALVVAVLVVGLVAARTGTEPGGPPPATAVATDETTPATTAVPPSTAAPTTTSPTTAVTPTPSSASPVTTPVPRPSKGKGKDGKDD